MRPLSWKMNPVPAGHLGHHQVGLSRCLKRLPTACWPKSLHEAADHLAGSGLGTPKNRGTRGPCGCSATGSVTLRLCGDRDHGRHHLFDQIRVARPCGATRGRLGRGSPRRWASTEFAPIVRARSRPPTTGRAAPGSPVEHVARSASPWVDFSKSIARLLVSRRADRQPARPNSVVVVAVDSNRAT